MVLHDKSSNRQLAIMKRTIGCLSAVLLLAVLVGGCADEPDGWIRAEDEERQIQDAISVQEVDAVEVLQKNEARRIEVTVTGGVADSLSVTELSSAEEAEQQAEALARELKHSYEAFENIEHLEVNFAKQANLGPVGASIRGVVEFDGENLQEL